MRKLISGLSYASPKNTHSIGVKSCTSQKRLIAKTMQIKRLFLAILL